MRLFLEFATSDLNGENELKEVKVLLLSSLKSDLNMNDILKGKPVAR